jgi:hypothetical protein
MIQVMAGLGPEVIAEYLDVEGYLRSVSTALGFNPDAMVKDPEQRKAEQEQKVALEQQMQPQGQPQLPQQ